MSFILGHMSLIEKGMCRCALDHVSPGGASYSVSSQRGIPGVLPGGRGMLLVCWEPSWGGTVWGLGVHWLNPEI